MESFEQSTLTVRSLPWVLSVVSCNTFLVALLGGKLANIFCILSPTNKRTKNESFICAIAFFSF